MENENNFNNSEFNFNRSEINFDKIKINRTSVLIIGLLLVAFVLYFYTPNLNPRFSSALSIYILLITFIVAFFSKSLKNAIVTYLLLSLLLFGANILSGPIFHSGAYYSLLGDVTTYDYKETQPNIDSNVLPVVDADLAKQLGDKVLGEQIGLGSQYMVGEYYLISTKDDLAWVAPLEPRGFFKWLQNRKGSPGYVYVSATNPNDVELVQTVDDEPIHIKYSNQAFFFKNIKRHTYFNGNMFRGMTDYSFEIDDNGNPFWVITNYTPSIGLKGDQTTGVIIVDAQTGETEFYSDYNNAPDWVERVQPRSLVMNQINYWGAYKNGFINSIFGQKEMITTTNGSSYVYIEGQPYFYTGLTSITNDQSTVGFMLVNSKTKESYFYQITGATENAAQKSAEGQVQQFGYRASFPILVNEFSTPAYFMTLKDADGLVKQYAYVSVENYNIVGVGDSVASAKTAYYDTLKGNNQLDTSVDEAAIQRLSGTIERINYIDNNYYLKLDASDELLIANSDVSNLLPFTQKGDKVEVEFILNEGLPGQVITFNNTSL